MGRRGLETSEEMRRPVDEDDGCKALLANWVAFFLFTSRAFEVSALSAACNVHIVH